MSDFWDDIITSTPIVNSATIISFVLAILFFGYQEYKARKEKAKEVIRLREEITNLIIRNHVNSGVPISRIDMNSLLCGFQTNKNCKLSIDNETLIQMVYAKVYENEHISNDSRLQLIKELDDILNSYELGLIEDPNVKISGNEIYITQSISTAITIFLSLFLALIPDYLLTKYNFAEYQISILILFLFVLIVYIKPYIDKSLNIIVDVLIEIFSYGQRKGSNSNSKIQQEPEIILKEGIEKINEHNSENEVKFEELFDNKQDIYEVSGQRIIMEHLLKKLYTKVFNEEASKMPISKIINILHSEGILPRIITSPIKRTYFFSSYVIHEGKLPPEMNSYSDLINYMKDIAVSLNMTLKEYKE